jgi:hypothetical protein
MLGIKDEGQGQAMSDGNKKSEDQSCEDNCQNKLCRSGGCVYERGFANSPKPCSHEYEHLDTQRQRDSSGYQEHFTRIDFFYCKKCLDMKDVKREDYARSKPDWY